MKDIKLLLVDDEKDFINTLAERLELRDLKSDIALDGTQALKAIDEEVPDVVVLDLKMPGMGGMEVLRMIKKKYPSAQVIIQTGHGTDIDEAEAQRLGVFDYLSKPVDFEHLVDRIKDAAEEARQEVETSLSAAAFAEEGELDTAQEMMKKKKKK